MRHEGAFGERFENLDLASDPVEGKDVVRPAFHDRPERHSDMPKNVGMPRGFHRAVLMLRSSDGERDLPLPCLAFVFPGPHSYTGEDSVEMQLPGNPILLQRVIDDLLATAERNDLAARHAEAGEFTARAFLNGRLSLTQAEGVQATIAAQSDAELRAAALLTSGSLGTLAHGLADELAAALALVEAGIDFTDQEDVVAIAPADLHARLNALRERVKTHLQRAVGFERLQAIPWVVLVGEPNAGKSALFNALLVHERAIVSPTAGTTRDVLAEPLTIANEHGPAEVMLVDLAGLDDADDSAINHMMQQRAREAIRRAELIIHCVPPGSDATRTDLRIDTSSAHAIVVHTKSDLAARGEARHGLAVSAVTGEGLESLRSAIALRLNDRAVSLAADALVLGPRHEAALRGVAENLDEALRLVSRSKGDHALRDPELVASSMRAALDDLAALAGDISPDDVLGRVFATFCVGK